jgi:hypothetical protein
MENPSFEEDGDKLKEDHEKPVLEVQEDKNIQSDEAEQKQIAPEEPSDEPDGGKKKDLPVKESPKKKRISFNLLGNSAASDDSHEENMTQKQLERYVLWEHGRYKKILFRNDFEDDLTLRKDIKSVKWGDEPKVNFENKESI